MSVPLSKAGIITSVLYPEGYLGLLLPDGAAVYGKVIVQAIVAGIPLIEKSVLFKVRERESRDFIARMELLKSMEGVSSDNKSILRYLSELSPHKLATLAESRHVWFPFAVARVMDEIISDNGVFPLLKPLVMALARNVRTSRDQRALLMFWYEIEITLRLREEMSTNSLHNAAAMTKFTRDTTRLRSYFVHPDLTLAERDAIRIELLNQKRAEHIQNAVEGTTGTMLEDDVRTEANKNRQMMRKARDASSALAFVPGGPAAAPIVAPVRKDNTRKNALAAPEYKALLKECAQDVDPRFGLFTAFTDNQDDELVISNMREREYRSFVSRVRLIARILRRKGTDDASMISAEAAATAIRSSRAVDTSVPFSVQAMKLMGTDKIAACLKSLSGVLVLAGVFSESEEEERAISLFFVEVELARAMFVPGHAFSRSVFNDMQKQFDDPVASPKGLMTMGQMAHALGMGDIPVPEDEALALKKKKLNEKKRQRRARQVAEAAAAQAAAFDKPASQA